MTGSNALSIHSGARFSGGGSMDSIHVSTQDPIWYALHTFTDRVHRSWQVNNTNVAGQMNGMTGTALNVQASEVASADIVSCRIEGISSRGISRWG
jgi:hypothetical protein